MRRACMVFMLAALTPLPLGAQEAPPPSTTPEAAPDVPAAEPLPEIVPEPVTPAPDDTTPEAPPAPSEQPATTTEEPLPEILPQPTPGEPAPASRVAPPVATLWDHGLKDVLLLGGVAAVAGVGGGVTGALVGAVLSLPIVIPAALLTRTVPAVSSVGIFTVFNAPPAMALAGALTGYLAARWLAGVATPLPSDRNVSRGKRALALLASEVLTNVILGGPLLLAMAAVGTATGLVVATTITVAGFPYVVHSGPSRGQLFRAGGGAYALAVATVLGPPVLVAIAATSPVLALIGTSWWAGGERDG